MADADSSNDEEVFNFESSDENSDFEGFDAAEIDYRHGEVIRNVEMSAFSPDGDVEIAADVSAGWTKIDRPPVNAPYLNESHMNIPVDDFRPIDFLKLFIKDEIIENLVVQTNLFAERRITNGQFRQHSRMLKWVPVDLEEMKVFLALVISMGLVQKDDLEKYWSCNEIDETPFFGKHMTRNRFQNILSNFHISDNELQQGAGQDGYDPLYKIRVFITAINTAFSDVYTPSRDLSVDEATCAWKGHLRFRVFNPAKPTRFGIKLYQVCEASSGYCLGFDVHTGDASTSCTKYCELLGLDEIGQTSKIVIGLLCQCGLLDKGHHVYLDNFYNSPELYEELSLLHTYACGTLRSNRKNVPLAIKQKRKMARFECIYRRNGDLLIVKYYDKRAVHMISTIREAEVSVLNKVDRQTNNLVMKPHCVVDYCRLMGGVDLSDQIHQYYTCLRKTAKWYKKLFFHLLNLTVINAYLLYKKFSEDENKLGHYEFRRALCESLIFEAPNAPKPSVFAGRRITGEKPGRLTERHFPESIPAAPGAKRLRPCRDCAACNPSKRQRQGFKRKQTSYWCSKCQKPLCVPNCFMVYHTVLHYKHILRPGVGAAGDAAENTDSSSDSN